MFSLVGPVPINDQVKAWELARLPEDWKAKRRRWDVQNAARVVLIGLAFIALVLSFRTLPHHGLSWFSVKWKIGRFAVS